MSVGVDWTALPVAGVATVDQVPARGPDGPGETEAPASIGFKAFDYQQEAFDAAWRNFDAGQRSTMVAMATGLGKTCLAGMMAKEEIARGGRVLLLAHRDELLEGAQSDLAFVGVESVIEKAEQKARDAIAAASRDFFHPRDVRCVVGSVQTLKGKRLASWDRDHFGLIICDEVHHAIKMTGPKRDRRTVDNPQYGAIFRHFASAKRFGLTGSPRRKDGAELGYWFESVAYQYLLADAIAKGDLCRIEQVRCDVKVDLKRVNMGAEDLNQGDLEDAIAPYIEEMCNAIKEQVGDRRFLLFAPGRKSVDQKVRPCTAFADGLRKVGISAEAVWGDHPDRLAIGRAFRNGDYQAICNADLYNEGVNFPFLEAVVLAAPTASPVVLGQRIGRGTRVYPGKSECLVVTFDWQFDRHKFALCEPYELVRPAGAAMAARIAAEIVASGEETDLVKAADLAERRAEDAERKRREAHEAAQKIARAREDAEKARRDRLERERVDLRVRERESGLGFVRIDPFASLATLLGKPKVDRNPNRMRATPGQVQALMDLGMPRHEAAALDFDEAREMKAFLFRRYQQNLAWPSQFRRLMQLGVPQQEAMAMSKWDASKRIEALSGNRRRSG